MQAIMSNEEPSGPPAGVSFGIGSLDQVIAAGSASSIGRCPMNETKLLATAAAILGL
jgi:hypothetical protein